MPRLLSLVGGNGADAIHGDKGNDSLFGETGNDHLFGDGGVDYLVGGDFIVLNGVAQASLDASDFILGNGASADLAGSRVANPALALSDSKPGNHLALMPALVHASDLFA